MIKQYKKVFWVFITTLILLLPPQNLVFGEGLEIKLDGVQKSRLLFTEKPKVFLPAYLLVGQNNTFRITGEPGQNVSLAMSATGQGIDNFYGLKLRIGDDAKTYTGIIPPSGVLELTVLIENEPNLIGTWRYFETVLWSQDDYSDITIASLVDATGRGTNQNYVKIVEPPRSDSGFSFIPSMPGVNEFVEAGKALQEMQEANENPNSIENDLRPSFYESDYLEKNVLIQNLNDAK